MLMKRIGAEDDKEGTFKVGVREVERLTCWRSLLNHDRVEPDANHLQSARYPSSVI